ncbi:3-demethylubiquinone-9 3-methyltransferase [Methylophaga lonarensis MPL]|uniref:Ubiquinone biosynthesis O-methyltransferase n=1 Tax=Methylophaga lonarensis MPL TaxID=1286106 RepID=M7PFE3_9GAMM|nr:bifunctional 2-polyprenyl-6-hydroxyphenol methylase/3-demethylubiquinol 3-O-methyltransferase UbiG [Methylophaga lonarensis]EMR12625.1 3-demethylubiquinone-9 3-methyltransferase [Methylophaga lonarensis MPL]
MSQIDQNVDPVEVAKFDALADSWWDPHGQSRPLHEINPLRLQYITDCSSGLERAKVIDVGCGGGILSEAMAKAGAEVTAIDMGEMPLNVARLHALESGLTIDYQQSTAEAMAARSANSFDIVTCMEMLEHVPDPATVIQACAILAKPGGDIFFSTLNRHPKAWLLAVFGAEYLLNILPKGTHDYQRFIRPSELAAWCRASGLQVMNITGINYQPLSKQFRLGQDVDVNYLMHCRLLP